ncbi:hypothetical protein L3X38_010061 [Prunus dulcis]|uniref:Uncharacterized protein n=1 Tax=Prunus dulcis TaxID=3755 RepID=A0AAD4ZE28_PRUDU|nr:hypothetical protein L3X38_010061 [Prunus dulcis]
MRQSSASSTKMAPEYHHPSGPAPPLPPDDAHPDGFAAKRMRKLTQRRAVDYTSTVVRYMQVEISKSPHKMNAGHMFDKMFQTYAIERSADYNWMHARILFLNRAS